MRTLSVLELEQQSKHAMNSQRAHIVELDIQVEQPTIIHRAACDLVNRG